MICLRFQSTKVEDFFFIAKLFRFFFAKKQKIIAISGVSPKIAIISCSFCKLSHPSHGRFA